MSLSVAQNLTAVAPGISAYFSANGGTPPYVYTIAPLGAGGTISNVGLYSAPSTPSSPPNSALDTVVVTDSLSATASAQILVGTHAQLVCDIIQTCMGLATGRVFLWNSKIFSPADNGLYVVVAISRCRPFGSTKTYDGATGMASIQALNLQATLDINIISRGPAARDQKELVLMTLNSDYALGQMSANSFSIGRIPAGSSFNDLSGIDGSAITYRYMIPVNIQYAVTNQTTVPYFTTFNTSIVQKES